MTATREQRVERAFFLGAQLTLENAAYRHALRGLAEVLLGSDSESADLTVKALGISSRRAGATIVTREPGIAAGLQEIRFLLEGAGLTFSLDKRDGEAIRPG